MRSKLTQLLALGILTFTLSGCSIGGTYYLRNFTSEPAKIILTLSEAGTAIFEEPTFSYSDELLKIRRNLYKKLENSTSGEFTDKRTLEFEVPAMSTLFLAIGSNMQMALIETIRIESISGSELINSDNHELLNLKMRGIGQYTGHYDIN
ncbi:MAG: hypothetical protein ABJN36_14185 [Cyclobacteriaceae bacterium]